MPDKEYIIFCDESETKGRYYSNFYGGLLVGSSQYDRLTRRFEELKASLNLHREVKWSKVTNPYLGKYLALMEVLFEELQAGHMKIRLMFRQNAHIATGLSEEQIEGAYFRLYYQFIKHAFGLKYRDGEEGPVGLRLYFDAFPATREAVQQFKGFIHALGQSSEFSQAGIFLKPDDITEVRSHDHVLLQMLDIVLGAMNFRLNDLHKEKPEGKARRGKRTVAKEKLYKMILGEIRKLHPRFNIGVSTGIPEGLPQRWTQAYRHWQFIPSQFHFDSTRTKRKGPTQPTLIPDAERQDSAGAGPKK